MAKMDTVASRIRKARKASGLYPAAFARAAGCDPQSLWRWENRDIQPRAESLARLAQVAGVRLEWLITGVGPMRVGEK